MGIGTRFLDEIAKIYIEKNWQVHIITSNRGLNYSLRRNKNWKLIKTCLNEPQISLRGEVSNKMFSYEDLKKYSGGSNLYNAFTRQITSFKTNKDIWKD